MLSGWGTRVAAIGAHAWLLRADRSDAVPAVGVSASGSVAPQPAAPTVARAGMGR